MPNCVGLGILALSVGFVLGRVFEIWVRKDK